MSKNSKLQIEYFRNRLIGETLKNNELSSKEKLERIEQYTNLDHEELIFLLIESHKNSCSIGHLLKEGIPMSF